MLTIIATWFLIVVYLAGALATTYMIGRPRTPLTADVAIVNAIIGLMTAILLYGSL